MAIPKFEKQYKEMIDNNKESFDELKRLGVNPKSSEFGAIQRKILRIIQLNENALCSKTESTKNLKFSMGLADKFRSKIRENYPEMDYSTN